MTQTHATSYILVCLIIDSRIDAGYILRVSIFGFYNILWTSFKVSQFFKLIAYNYWVQLNVTTLLQRYKSCISNFSIFFISVIIAMATNFKASSEKYVGFFGKHHPFSNFHPCPLTYKTSQLDGQGTVTNSKMTLHFNTTEALYQWKKVFSTPTKNNCFPSSKISPPDGEICQSIRLAESPAACKKIGRKAVVDFEKWTLNTRVNAMREIIGLKFPPISPNHPSLPRDWDPNLAYTINSRANLSVQLLCTGNLPLIELSPYDNLWGVGKNKSNFDHAIRNLSQSTGSTVDEVLVSLTTVPVPDDITEPPRGSIGINLLGRILMEQRKKLRESCFAIRLKPLSESNCQLLRKRLLKSQRISAQKT